MREPQNFMVCVQCLTFNHAKFIEKALDGFTMQQTTFPYICCIVDDASTDGEQEIIKKYICKHFNLSDRTIVKNEDNTDYYLTFVQHNENKNCFFAVIFLKYNHYSIKKSKLKYFEVWQNMANYISFCEGDDYWIVKNKLQLQVDFLETHTDYSMCHGDAYYYIYEKKSNKGNIGKIQSRQKSFDSDSPQEMFYKILNNDYGNIVTNTVLIRKTCLDKRIPNTKSFMMGDKPLWLDMSQMGRIKYLDMVLGVYVKHQGSATRNPKTRLLFTLNTFEMRIYYCKKFDYPIPVSTLQLYKKAYLALFFKGKELPLLDIPELMDFIHLVEYLKTHRRAKMMTEFFYKLDKKKDVIINKVRIAYLYFSNYFWKTGFHA